MAREDLTSARVGRNDEFYTQLCDIERELQYYPNCFSGKIVYCNCDDPKVSNIFMGKWCSVIVTIHTKVISSSILR